MTAHVKRIHKPQPRRRQEMDCVDCVTDRWAILDTQSEDDA
jgi:hypothetical protein